MQEPVDAKKFSLKQHSAEEVGIIGGQDHGKVAHAREQYPERVCITVQEERIIVTATLCPGLRELDRKVAR